MTFPRAVLLGLATASALAVTVPVAHAQTAAAPGAAPATTVPPAASTTTPAEIPAPGGKPHGTSHDHSRGMAGYLGYLHDELKITPAEEPLWASFADSMRANAKQLGAAYRQRRDQLPKMTALQDMTSFMGIEQMRLDGMKTSSVAFTALYQAMPPDQQKLADTVFLSDMPGAPRHRAPKPKN
jgi:protein CpxP